MTSSHNKSRQLQVCNTTWCCPWCHCLGETACQSLTGCVRFSMASAGMNVAPICCVIPPASPSCSAAQHSTAHSMCQQGISKANYLVVVSTDISMSSRRQLITTPSGSSKHHCRCTHLHVGAPDVVQDLGLAHIDVTQDAADRRAKHRLVCLGTRHLKASHALLLQMRWWGGRGKPSGNDTCAIQGAWVGGTGGMFMFVGFEERQSMLCRRGVLALSEPN
jgi:hypothetical protein